jgi:hypothetical protein
VAVQVMSLLCPGVVAALWGLLRRRGRLAWIAPALFGLLVASGGLMVPAAASPLALSALAIAAGLACVALIDFASRKGGGHAPDEDENEGDGGTGRRLSPPRPSGGPAGDPLWWPEFERTFWAHVRAGSRTPGTDRLTRRP